MLSFFLSETTIISFKNVRTFIFTGRKKLFFLFFLLSAAFYGNNFISSGHKSFTIAKMIHYINQDLTIKKDDQTIQLNSLKINNFKSLVNELNSDSFAYYLSLQLSAKPEHSELRKKIDQYIIEFNRENHLLFFRGVLSFDLLAEDPQSARVLVTTNNKILTKNLVPFITNEIIRFRKERLSSMNKKFVADLSSIVNFNHKNISENINYINPNEDFVISGFDLITEKEQFQVLKFILFTFFLSSFTSIFLTLMIGIASGKVESEEEFCHMFNLKELIESPSFKKLIN